MQKIEITLRSPLPTNAEALRERLAELARAKHEIEAEMRDIYGTAAFLGESRKLAVCVRCNHEWFPRPWNTPRQCPYCHSNYWNRPKVPRRSQLRAQGHKSRFIKRDLPPLEAISLVPPPSINQETEEDAPHEPITPRQ